MLLIDKMRRPRDEGNEFDGERPARRAFSEPDGGNFTMSVLAKKKYWRILSLGSTVFGYFILYLEIRSTTSIQDFSTEEIIFHCQTAVFPKINLHFVFAITTRLTYITERQI